ncbi:MAG: hypothetical protein ACPL4K_02560 [Candidatus Margulisiibacteriota bacterium]
MGGAFAGLADDANAIFINPAGIGTLRKEAALVASRIAEGREYTMLSGVETTPLGNLGIGYVAAADPIENVDLGSGDGSIPVKYLSQSLYLTYARDLSTVLRVPDNLGKLSLGINAKFSSRKLTTANGLSQNLDTNFDLDLAWVFRPNDNLSLGMSLQNFLNGDKVQEIANLNPVEERKFTTLFGASGKLFKNLTWTVEGEELGGEWQLTEGLALRAGRGKESFSSGIGISLGGLSVDYAYVKKDNPVHYVSVSIVPQDSNSIKKAGINIE